MDPNATQARIDQARADVKAGKEGARAELREAQRDLREWRAKGGFAPERKISVKPWVTAHVREAADRPLGRPLHDRQEDDTC